MSDLMNRSSGTSGTPSTDHRPVARGSGLTRTERKGNGTLNELFQDIQHEDFSPAVKSISQAISRPSLSYWEDAWIRLKKNKQALASLGVVIALVLFTLVGPLVWRIDPAAQDLSRISEAPTLEQDAVVLSELEAFEEIVVPGVPEAPVPPAEGASSLPAPTGLSFVGEPSNQAVRLKWNPVPGAAAYVVYRADAADESSTWGVPIAEVEGGNKVSYEDRFNLEPKSYVYTVVAKNVDESTNASRVKAKLAVAVSLETARATVPDAKPGDFVKLPAHPLGTDYLGRDLLSRLMAGARVSLFIGFFAPVIYILLGVLIGGIAGYAGGKVDHYLMRFTDFVLALPFLLFMILFKVAFGVQAGENGVGPMLIALVALSWTGAARLTRGQVLQLRESEFVQASRLLGAKPMYLILRHLLPNTMGVILVSLTFAIPSAIFTEAFLSFIGMGVVPPTPSWGSMCNDGIQTFLTHPHEFFFPAILISITVLAFNLLGDGLRDALDPRMRSVQ